MIVTPKSFLTKHLNIDSYQTMSMKKDPFKLFKKNKVKIGINKQLVNN